MPAKGARAAFAGAVWTDFFEQGYAAEKVRNEIQPNLQTG
jgi:hypothetical protein